ncbi:MAG: hypothetical protein VKL39_03815, partial [Leptolyngbyaceae bacterium]|nr:hypothetical protein [Leptolyngbyaceae bacterium]
WSRAAQILIDLLDASDELRIYYETSGHSQVWKVYDPVAGRLHRFATEDEVRVWLEQRHHR